MCAYAGRGCEPVRHRSERLQRGHRATAIRQPHRRRGETHRACAHLTCLSLSCGPIVATSRVLPRRYIHVPSHPPFATTHTVWSRRAGNGTPMGSPARPSRPLIPQVLGAISGGAGNQCRNQQELTDSDEETVRHPHSPFTPFMRLRFAVCGGRTRSTAPIRTAGHAHVSSMILTLCVHVQEGRIHSRPHSP